MHGLEAYQPHRKLHLARPTQASHARRKERLARCKHRMRRIAEQAHTVVVKAQVLRANNVEDIHEEIEMMALSLQREVLHHAQIEVRKCGLPR